MKSSVKVPPVLPRYALVRLVTGMYFLIFESTVFSRFEAIANWLLRVAVVVVLLERELVDERTRGGAFFGGVQGELKSISLLPVGNGDILKVCFAAMGSFDFSVSRRSSHTGIEKQRAVEWCGTRLFSFFSTSSMKLNDVQDFQKSKLKRDWKLRVQNARIVFSTSRAFVWGYSRLSRTKTRIVLLEPLWTHLNIFGGGWLERHGKWIDWRRSSFWTYLYCYSHNQNALESFTWELNKHWVNFCPF